MTTNVLILGAAGRDFHNFNTFFRNNREYKVACFTATQIPEIADRKYPPSLAGELYPEGIPIFDENGLEELIESHKIDEVYFSYSDVSDEHVMHLAARAQAKGATFVLLGPKRTSLKSSKKVIAVTAVRTGCGKSPLTKKLTEILKSKGVKFAVVRHPMPYGNLAEQAVQRFATLEDLDRHHCTIEEREEYEPHIRNGAIVYAGVDYERVLRDAEKEADIILWDGGNNDFSFYQPDLLFCVADSLRPGHEIRYYPGETNARMADIVIINKFSENEAGAKTVRSNIEKLNPKAKIIEADMELSAEVSLDIRDKSVIVVEDGPTVTHGGMGYGAGFLYASGHGGKIMDIRSSAVGSILQAYDKFPHLKQVVPAMGYFGKQLEDLQESINKSGADVVISGTPIDLGRVLKIDIPILHVLYSIKERNGSIEKAVDGLLRS
ncbi:MAG: cyclic 2,3-diphosphoglycerate synthase [Candidatus Micrarchaeota archaeon]